MILKFFPYCNCKIEIPGFLPLTLGETIDTTGLFE